jgi:hypothetical protein
MTGLRFFRASRIRRAASGDSTRDFILAEVRARCSAREAYASTPYRRFEVSLRFASDRARVSGSFHDFCLADLNFSFFAARNCGHVRLQTSPPSIFSVAGEVQKAHRTPAGRGRLHLSPERQQEKLPERGKIYLAALVAQSSHGTRAKARTRSSGERARRCLRDSVATKGCTGLSIE